jgi:soluble lytic murein transglycosylase
MGTRHTARFAGPGALIGAVAILAGCGGILKPYPVTEGRDAGAPGEHEVAAEPVLVAVDDLGPYFEDVFNGEAARALAGDRLEEAMRLFDEIAREVSDPVLTPRARFLAALLAGRQGDDARVLSEMPGLAGQLPLLADSAWEMAARAASALGQHGQALDLARRVSRDATEAQDASRIAAESLAALGRIGEAAAAFEEHLSRWPGTEDSGAMEVRLVECLATLAADEADPDRATHAERALDRIDRIRAQDAEGRYLRRAERQEDALREILGREPQARLRETAAALAAWEAAADQVRRMRNAEAERALPRVIKLARRGGRLECQARLALATVVSRQRRHQQAADLFDESEQGCPDPDLRVRALYLGGRALVSADRLAEAIVSFETLERDFPTHSYADDARLRAARCHLTLGDRERFYALVRSLPDDYPDGDMRAEALWAGAHEALEREDLEAAREILSRYFELFPVEDDWYAAGRAGYWLGRVEQLLGQEPGAAERFEHVLATTPLSFYMVLSHSRLAAIDEERAASLLRHLAPPGGAVTARFDEAWLAERPSLAKGVELLRLGLTTRGSRELRRLVDDPQVPAEVHLVVAALFRRMGVYTEARSVAAAAPADWRRRFPSGPDLAHWALAYPDAYRDFVEAAAEESGVPAALIWAVMREESGFNTRVESWANAVGLMQLILPTARGMGTRLGLKVTARSLRDPETNIRLGAAYLGFLWKKFEGRVPLVIAGYNAGEGAVARWIKEHPGRDIDLFVEEIPFQQTRGYTKRVIASFATYLYLYEEDRPIYRPEPTLP